MEVPVDRAGGLDMNVVDETRLPYPPSRGFAMPTSEQIRFGASLRVTVTDDRDALVGDQRGIGKGGSLGGLSGLRVPAGRYRVRLWQGDRVVDEAIADVRADAVPMERRMVVLRPPP